MPFYLIGSRKSTTVLYRWLYIIAVFIGPYLTVEAVWNMADIFNGLMALPNIIALLALSGVIAREYQSVFQEKCIAKVKNTLFYKIVASNKKQTL